MTTGKCSDCRDKWPGCGAATNVYAGNPWDWVAGVLTPTYYIGCASHYQPRQDAKSCETCGNTDFSDRGCIFSPSQCYPSKGNTSHWTPIVAPAPAADERVGSAREYLENNTIGREAFVIFDGLLAVAEEMRGHLDGDKRKMYGIIKNLEQEREEARARVKKLEGENESLREALNLDITMNKELQARVKELEELVDLLKQNDGDLVISQLRIRVSELKDERENLVRRVRELEGENTEMAHRELDHKMQIDGRDQRIMELEAEVRGQLVTAKELDDARCARIAELEAELKSERREHAEWQGQSDRWKELYQKECEKRQDDLVQRGRQVKGWISRGCIVDGVNLGCDFVDVQFNRDPDYPIPVTLTIEEGDK